LLSFSDSVAKNWTPQASSPAASSSAQMPAEGGTTKWSGSSAHSAALPTVLTSAIEKTTLETASVRRLRTHSLAPALPAACGRG
jgi:hypothetical protein